MLPREVSPVKKARVREVDKELDYPRARYVQSNVFRGYVHKGYLIGLLVSYFKSFVATNCIQYQIGNFQSETQFSTTCF